MAISTGCCDYVWTNVCGCFTAVGNWRKPTPKKSAPDTAEEPLLQNSESINYSPNSTQPAKGYFSTIGSYCYDTAAAIGSCFNRATSPLYKVTASIANFINTPFSVFLWYAMWKTYNEINVYANGEDAAKLDSWSTDFIALSIFNIIRLSASTFLDFMSTDLVNSELSSNKAKDASLFLRILYRIIQLIFLITASAYSLSYVTGMVLLLSNGSFPVQIIETILFGGLGTFFYYLFTNVDIGDHVFGLPDLWGEMSRCFKDPTHAARMLLCLESVLVMAMYRMILAGNDWLTFVETIDYMKDADDSTIKYIYLVILGATLVSTCFSRVRSIHHNMCPPLLTPREKDYKKKLSYINCKDILTLLRCLSQSAAITYLLWSNRALASTVGSIYALAQVLINVDINRTYRAIACARKSTAIENPENGTTDASTKALPCEFDNTIERLKMGTSTLAFVAVVLAMLGRSTRLDPLPAFITSNDNALDKYDIISLKFATDSKLSISIYVGMLTVLADIGWYSGKVLNRFLNLSLRLKVYSQEAASSLSRSCYQILFDWTKKEDYDQNKLLAAVPIHNGAHV